MRCIPLCVWKITDKWSYISLCVRKITKRMMLYSPGCMENNKQMKLYSSGCMKIRNKLRCIPLGHGVWQISNKWWFIPLLAYTIIHKKSVVAHVTNFVEIPSAPPWQKNSKYQMGHHPQDFFNMSFSFSQSFSFLWNYKCDL